MSTYERPQRGSLSAPPPVGVLADRGALRAVVEWVRGITARAFFLAVALPVGIFLVFAIPPFEGLDEPNHFFRVYSISGGAIIAPFVAGDAGDRLPACVHEYALGLFAKGGEPVPFHLSDFFTVPPGCDARASVFYPFDNTAEYSPISYAPQSIGVTIARWLGAPLPIVFYAGRLFALLAYVGLVFLSLTLATRGKWAILVVGLMPMSLTLGSQFSADGMTIAYALLLVGAVIHCLCSPRATWWGFVLTVAAAAALALCKSTYFALAPLLLLVPNRLFPSRWWAGGAKVGGLCLVGLLLGLWYLQVRGIRPGGAILGVDPRGQIEFILHNKKWYAGFLASTLFGPVTGYFTWQGFVSWVGFSRSVTAGSPAPPPLIMAAGIGLVAIAYRVEMTTRVVLSNLSVARAALPLALVAVNAVLIVTALYVTVLPVAEPALWLQGRYLLPLAAVPVISLLALQQPDVRERSILPIAPVVLVLLGYLVVKVVLYFY
jgi:uncharacterized membrane protein